jgi:acetylglutamate kinase
MKKLYIIKIGGNLIDNETELKQFLADFHHLEGPKILVHGGGKLATELSAKLKIETSMVDGRRITDDETLKIVTMVYAGWINKSIVATLQSLKSNAIGLSGADAHCIKTSKRTGTEIDYGFVGDVSLAGINTRFFQDLLKQQYIPVISPITSDDNGQLLNTNADTIASTLAVALSNLYQVHLIYCFDKKGVLLYPTDDNSVIHSIDTKEYHILKNNGAIANGMIPKLDNAFSALQKGVSAITIGSSAELNKLTNKQQHAGTYIQI